MSLPTLAFFLDPETWSDTVLKQKKGWRVTGTNEVNIVMGTTMYQCFAGAPVPTVDQTKFRFYVATEDPGRKSSSSYRI